MACPIHKNDEEILFSMAEELKIPTKEIREAIEDHGTIKTFNQLDYECTIKTWRNLRHRAKRIEAKRKKKS